jgi:serine/threonine-protein kinase
VKLSVSQGQGDETVPDVAGSSLSAAQAELQRLGFQVGGPEEESSTSVTSGNVIRTDSAAGQVIAKGSVVTVFVSSGAETVQVPDVRNQEETTAIASLKSQGLEASVTTKVVPAGDPAVGRVTSQNPVPKTVVDVGSTVTILVGVAGETTTTTTTSP